MTTLTVRKILTVAIGASGVIIGYITATRGLTWGVAVPTFLLGIAANFAASIGDENDAKSQI